MSAAQRERGYWKAVHVIHAAAFFVLLTTGFLLFSPTLRASVLGGYSLHLRQIHSWVGVGFGLLPIAFMAMLVRRPASAAATGNGFAWLGHWRRSHLLFTILATLVFSASGLVLWFKRWFPLAVMDGSSDLHKWLTYGSCVVLLSHLAIALVYPTLRQLFRSQQYSAASDPTSSRAQ